MLQLENPAQKRSLNEILASIPAADIAAIAPRLAKIERLLRRQSERDRVVVESVCRVLEFPGHQRLAVKLRRLLNGGR